MIPTPHPEILCTGLSGTWIPDSLRSPKVMHRPVLKARPAQTARVMCPPVRLPEHIAILLSFTPWIRCLVFPLLSERNNCLPQWRDIYLHSQSQSVCTGDKIQLAYFCSLGQNLLNG